MTGDFIAISKVAEDAFAEHSFHFYPGDLPLRLVRFFFSPGVVFPSLFFPSCNECLTTVLLCAMHVSSTAVIVNKMDNNDEQVVLTSLTNSFLNLVGKKKIT